MKIKSKKIPLKEVATFLNGYAFKPSDWSKEGLPIIRIQNLTGTNKEFNYYNGDYNEKYIIEDGDILISWSASLGIFLWKNITGILNQHIFKVIFDKDIEIDKLYFLHCMKYLIKKIEKNIHGSTMKHITRPEFEKINFPIYDIDLQRKIAKKLIFISEIINNNKKILVKLMDLSKSLFTTMFGDIKTNDKNWEIKKLKELVEIKSFIINENLNFIWLLNLEDIEPNTGKLIKKREVSFKNIPSSTISFNENYVLYSKLRPYLNKVFLPDEKGFGTSELVPLLPKKNIHKIFLTEYLRNDKIVDFLSQKVSGAKMPRVIMKDFQDLNLIFPPIELQNKFAERIENIEKLKFEIEKSIETAQNLYDSLISKYFDN
ncbi:restriction endonuclease subunit S [Fusobacterium pseudoperiodonticum]|uniref:Restriction endonuclease subunit R n=1 Tax=Fusobacterium pseudoperiodonticum TaxID=2663009 RepID=A0A2D3NSL5_9FUSO|nr:restriction endonuclease subunit S [Fusobacterium pseudoperiodonticum]ATV58352.1 restriction endonuclease subunit R [Fusobacterium pseudoperiodonticum]